MYKLALRCSEVALFYMQLILGIHIKSRLYLSFIYVCHDKGMPHEPNSGLFHYSIKCKQDNRLYILLLSLAFLQNNEASGISLYLKVKVVSFRLFFLTGGRKWAQQILYVFPPTRIPGALLQLDVHVSGQLGNIWQPFALSDSLLMQEQNRNRGRWGANQERAVRPAHRSQSRGWSALFVR